MQGHKEAQSLGILEPQQRLKALTNYSSAIEVDPSVPPKRYYRSGLEMVRMANVYFEEGSLENAYVLYMKFMTLFIEKMRKHPEYNTVSVNDRITNQAQLRDVLPKAEKLKVKLLEQFTAEYNRYLREVKQREEEEETRKKRQADMKERLRNAAPKPHIPSAVQRPESLDLISYPDSTAPTAPPAAPDLDRKSPERYSTGPSSKPEVNRASKPIPVTTSQEDSNSKLMKFGFRTVVTPAKVMTHFLTLSQKNTFNNIETCGILAGKLEKHQLIITHVILPKQKGTPDSCMTTNEEEIFDYQDNHNLITIGWIHTHPTQTAFLSSVDLHTHCPYQMLMPEAIAIVCAPKYEETGFFILTPNYGLQYIAGCRQTGFHPHPTDPPLFMTAEHVKVDTNAPLEVLDLR